MTNGEKIQTILDVDRDCTEVHGENGTMTFTVTQDFWNAEYNEPTTKNDLGVDCIDRQATLDAIIKRLGIKNETYLLEAERVIYQQILAMPSVTPQEPILDKIREEIKVMTSNRGFLSCSVDHIHEEIDNVFDKFKAESEETWIWIIQKPLNF